MVERPGLGAWAAPAAGRAQGRSAVEHVSDEIVVRSLSVSVQVTRGRPAKGNRAATRPPAEDKVVERIVQETDVERTSLRPPQPRGVFRAPAVKNAVSREIPAGGLNVRRVVCEVPPNYVRLVATSPLVSDVEVAQGAASRPQRGAALALAFQA